jgi:hypothetical protein
VSHLTVRNLQDAGRTTSMWDAEAFETPSRVGDVAMALVPASLILAAATALMLALL